MVMTPYQHTSSVPILLLALYGLTQQLAIAIPVVGDGPGDRESNAPALPEAAQLWRAQAEPGKGWARAEESEVSLFQTPTEERLYNDVDPKALATMLLEALSLTGGEWAKGKRVPQGVVKNPVDRGDLERTAEEQHRQPEGKANEEQNRQAAQEEEVAQSVEGAEGPARGEHEEEKEKEMAEEERLEKGQEKEEERKGLRNLQTMLEELQRQEIATKEAGSSALSRQARGYFPNIDLGLQDNEILPPLKGYKSYNQELARAGKKLKWQEEKSRKNRPLYGGGMNFASDFDEGVDDDDDEFLTREEEEARARAEQEEVRRQAAEAQRARAEEERLADIASDRVLQYMVKKQGAVASSQRRKAALATNAIEDKRSEEEEDDDDNIDSQTIDKLIEISSKLHLPADDIVDIISDVEEKKKRKDSPESFSRYRPLVPPPAPASRYSAPNRPPLLVRPYGPWFKAKQKAKARKQDFWHKPQKQFLAYPSYPFYQKPYRAYYPVYFPLPKPKQRYYAKSALSFDELLGNSMDNEFNIPKRRYRPWAQPPRKRPSRPQSPYISNYILPHPRTYQALPKARSQLRHPSIFYPAPVPQDNNYYDPTGQQQTNSDEDLENFIEKVYLKRRIFQ